MSLSLEKDTAAEERNMLGAMLRAKDPEMEAKLFFDKLLINAQTLLYFPIVHAILIQNWRCGYHCPNVDVCNVFHSRQASDL